MQSLPLISYFVIRASQAEGKFLFRTQLIIYMLLVYLNWGNLYYIAMRAAESQRGVAICLVHVRTGKACLSLLHEHSHLPAVSFSSSLEFFYQLVGKSFSFIGDFPLTTIILTSRLLSFMSFSFPTNVSLTFLQCLNPIITIRAHQQNLYPSEISVSDKSPS